MLGEFGVDALPLLGSGGLVGVVAAYAEVVGFWGILLHIECIIKK